MLLDERFCCDLGSSLPYTPLAEPLGFVPLPSAFLAAMLTLVALYAAAAELVKRWFYGVMSRTRARRSSATATLVRAEPS